MVVFESLRIALRALAANKMRSMLTTLGIIIGVAAVIAVVSIVQGLQFMIVGQLQGVGATYLRVLPQVRFNAPGQVVRPVLLTGEDADAIVREVPGIEAMSPLIFGNESVKYRERQHRPTFIAGVGGSWQEVVNQWVDEGHFFTSVEIRQRQKVAVVGRTVVEELHLGDPVGKEIAIGNLSLTVVGVMEEQGQTLGQDSDDVVFVPFETALSLFGRDAADQIQIHLRLADTDAVDAARDGITRLMRRRHNLARDTPDDFQVQTQDDLLELFNTILGSITLVFGGVVGIALLVGGIGIMNIMLVSVTERTREIGLRKAVGARKRDILLQFLIEAVTLSFVGGGIGLALGYGVGALVTWAFDMPKAHVPFWAVLLAFGVSAATGIFFGSWPAGKAARLDPIEALRYE